MMEFFLLRLRVQNCFGTHSASYPMGTGGSYPGSKAAATPTRLHGVGIN
jgi:hypothetical protein